MRSRSAVRRHRSPRRAAAFGAWVAIVVLVGAANARAGDAPRADSTATVAPSPNAASAPSDSASLAPAVGGAPADSAARSTPGAARAPESSREIDADRLRLDGRTSLRSQWLGRWPAQAIDLPLPSDVWDRPVTFDAGVPPAGPRASTTDRTPVAGFFLRFGLPNAATAVAPPGRATNDPLLVAQWGDASPRPVMEGPAELLAAPRPTLWWEAALRSRGAQPRATESAVFFERGDLGLENVGARFTAPALGPGLAAAYTRRTSDGPDAFWRATDTRYAGAAMLRWRGSLRGWIEGDIAKRRIEDAYDSAGGGRARAGESLLDDRSLALHLERRAGAWEQRFRAETARSRHSTIEIDGVRTRWEAPSWTLGAESRWHPSAGWTWIASAHATGRDLRFRAGPGLTPIGVLDTRFDEGVREARAGLALRRDGGRRGRARGWGADVAYDARENDRGYLDARIHASAASRRGMLRADLESSHERPTEEDRRLPERDRVFEDVIVLPKPLRYTVSGDPGLRARRLSGVAAAGSWRAANRVEFFGTGSARYVTDDFGWDLTRVETPDSIFVEDRATRRGSGWSRHASLGVAATWGRLGARALGWTRAGASTLSPRGGSLARTGLDASADLALTLFRGDLPLRIGVEAQIAGRRGAPIRAASTALFNASVRADFGEAGLYLRVEDLADRR
ncbi:MAG TPA: hypothetical protein VFU59_05610, partial [Candidatus Eisenbacteria bacterium]|nr:hypothetical protein [Candidatus Eisenbacteria bacterium]